MFPPALAAFGLVAGAIAAAGLLVLGRVDLASSTARLAALGLMVSTAVTVAGLVVGRSRWAQRHGWVLVGVGVLISAVSRPVDAWFAASLAIGAITAIALGLRPVTTWLSSVERRVPVPREAVLLLLLLLNAPLAVAAINPDGVNGVSIAASVVAWLLMWSYSRAWVAALWLLRFGLPVIAVGWGWGADWWGWMVAVLLSIVALWAAWSEGALLAAQPLEPRKVTARPILAELAPEDVRRVAGIDDRGQRS